MKMEKAYTFLKKKPSLIIIVLKDESTNWYPSKIARYCGASYVYTTKLIDEIKKLDLVRVEKKGKYKSIRLTEKGKVIAGLLEEVKNRFEIKTEEKKQIQE